ncbi:hypothetical protein AB0K92_11460 [Streptomyces sp. NPDC052687]|uniref:hypothetical protein n=1 Tax=Streptomyces sp. NPDC052687 TaxID=3154759 RepID=UPI00342A81A6
MINRRTTATATATALTAASLGTALAGAAPASAGGIGDFLSPAFGTSCANHHTGAHARGATTHGTGTADGNLAGLPVGSALNQCGGADAPLSSHDRGVCVITQWFSGTNIRSGHMSKDAAGVSADTVNQVITLLSEANVDATKPVTEGACG